ncbi:hypothetical protein M3Y99_01996800 [Aphelenchoides fujianensis]|nr:hypothetical protein M3Y99_01996800 [Aphelenchoides fujianensis]
MNEWKRERTDKFAQEIDPPPAYSLAAFCTKRKTKQSPTILIAAFVFSVLLVAVLLGGVLFENRRLNAVNAEQNRLISEQKSMIERLGGLCEVKKAEWKSGRQAEEPEDGKPAVEVRECWRRVANLTKELAILIHPRAGSKDYSKSHEHGGYGDHSNCYESHEHHRGNRYSNVPLWPQHHDHSYSHEDKLYGGHND